VSSFWFQPHDQNLKRDFAMGRRDFTTRALQAADIVTSL
jgi:hypothetical protein